MNEVQEYEALPSLTLHVLCWSHCFGGRHVYRAVHMCVTCLGQMPHWGEPVVRRGDWLVAE